MPYISVVIGFKNWGLKRLELAVSSIRDSFGNIEGEVIISDYGSDNPQLNQELAQRLGVSYVYTETSGEWSRSRALNAGFAVARGEFLVSTDADMIFSPKSFEIIADYAKSDPYSAYFLQCRDLPEGMDDVWVEKNPGSWSYLESESRLRPRWGMGGMMAIHREGFERLRGFDERLVTYGGEDLDFAQRARRVGYKTTWIDDPRVRMYHMWHIPTSNVVAKSEEATRAVQFNRSIVYNDKTFVRNYLDWRFHSEYVRPLVTVAISTRNRADLINETIQSVLFQSVQDFEIIVVDDGGSDNLEEVISNFHDPRIKYFWIEHAGISAARNVALDHSRGIYTAVIDDDDLMHPERLRWHFEDLIEGMQGTVGSFVNFHNSTGSMDLFVSMTPARYTTVEKGSAPGHGTWLIETDVLRQFRYDENITSGVDNNIMLRMLRAGVNIGHTGKPVTLRRMHDRQVTVTDNVRQIGAAKNSLDFFKWNIASYYLKKLEEEKESRGAYPKTMPRDEMLAIVSPFLPDHLTTRDLVFISPSQGLHEEWDGIIEGYSVEIEGFEAVHYAKLLNATYGDLVRARKLNLDFVVQQNLEGGVGEDKRSVDWINAFLDTVSLEKQKGAYLVLWPEIGQRAENARKLVVRLSDEESRWSFIITSSSHEVADKMKNSGAICIGEEFSGVEK